LLSIPFSIAADTFGSLSSSSKNFLKKTTEKVNTVEPSVSDHQGLGDCLWEVIPYKSIW